MASTCWDDGYTRRCWTIDQNPSLDYSTLEWAAAWKSLPKVVFSTTLSAVQGNARLASSDLAEEIEQLRAEPRGRDIAIGRATLAAEAAALDGGRDSRSPTVGEHVSGRSSGANTRAASGSEKAWSVTVWVR